MYTDATATAESVVDNCLNSGAIDTGDCLNRNGSLTSNASTSEWMPLGYPEEDSNGDYTLWTVSSANSMAGKSALLTGDELLYAASDYYGILEPLIDEIAVAEESAKEQEASDFIAGAEEDGWIMAGEWFWKLAIINSKNSSISLSDIAKATVSNVAASALQSTFKNSICPYVKTAAKSGDSCDNLGYSRYASLSSIAVQKLSVLYDLLTYNIGSTTNKTTPITSYPDTNSIPGYNFNAETIMQLSSDAVSSSALSSINFPNVSFVPSWDTISYSGSFWNFENWIKDAFVGITILMLNLFIVMLNYIIEPLIYEIFTAIFTAIIPIFQTGVEQLNSSSNPILSIAAMGNAMINETMVVLLNITAVVMMGAAIPVVSTAVIAAAMILLPIIFGVIGIIFVSGVIYAYYIPMLPYLLFTFGGIAWMISVIESMIAAPIVALGITHPEGHQTFGKADQAIMLLLNVFLRPSMMILGYIPAIILSYIGIWLLNLGFSTAMSGAMNQYSSYAYNFGIIFMMLIYTGAYVGITQKSFEYGINKLPDGILKWLGGGVQSFGSEMAGEINRDMQAQGKEHGQGMYKGVSGGTSASGAGGGGGDDDGGGTGTAKSGGKDDGGVQDGGDAKADGNDDGGGSGGGGAGGSSGVGGAAAV